MQGHSDPNRELLDAAALCRQLVPEGSVEAFLADHRRELFPDEMFEDLFSSRRGRPSVPADVVASVMVLQALEGLSDRDAARALRDRISWKVACGLALDDEGFDFTGAHLLAHSIAEVRAPGADLRRRALGHRRHRDPEGKDPPGPRLDPSRRRRGHPGHRHPVDRRHPSGAPGRPWGDRLSPSRPTTTSPQASP